MTSIEFCETLEFQVREIYERALKEISEQPCTCRSQPEISCSSCIAIIALAEVERLLVAA